MNAWNLFWAVIAVAWLGYLAFGQKRGVSRQGAGTYRLEAFGKQVEVQKGRRRGTTGPIEWVLTIAIILVWLWYRWWTHA